ncbi:MAG TPA: spermidine synthase [Sphingomonas sp.]|nr:spermidine synthase [Sphingomonas sp.]
MGQLHTANKRHRRASNRARLLSPGGGTTDWPIAAPAPPANDRDPVETIAAADIPGGGKLHLLRCGPDFSIKFGPDELMGSHDHRSEQALATLACARVGAGRGDVLIGGLGMGFTLRAALDCWGPAAAIRVAELVPELVSWARGPLAHLFDDALDDERVTIAIADVHDLIAGADRAFDAILLDVDNGPDGFMRPENDRIYCNWGLREAHAALRPGGVLAIWSAYADRAFGAQLEAIGFEVEEVQVAGSTYPDANIYTIWLASRPA